MIGVLARAALHPAPYAAAYLAPPAVSAPAPPPPARKAAVPKWLATELTKKRSARLLGSLAADLGLAAAPAAPRSALPAYAHYEELERDVQATEEAGQTDEREAANTPPLLLRPPDAARASEVDERDQGGKGAQAEEAQLRSEVELGEVKCQVTQLLLQVTDSLLRTAVADALADAACARAAPPPNLKRPLVPYGSDSDSEHEGEKRQRDDGSG